MTKYFPTFYFILLLLTLLSGCTSLTMFDEDPFVTEPKTAKPNQPVSNQSEISAKPPSNQHIKVPSKQSQPVKSPKSQERLPVKPQPRDEMSSQLPQPIKSPKSQKPLPIKPQPPDEISSQPQIDKDNPRVTNILSSYKLDAGDLISIKVFGEDDFSVTTHLSESGTISYPFLGELKLVGLTVNQVEQLIITGLQDDYLINPKVTVTILEYRKVFINGEVKQPGGYTFVPGLTIEKAISLAGGLTEIASPDDISIVEHSDEAGIPKRVNMKTFVRPGDIIIVKEYPKFFVNGEVNKPGAYAYEPSLTVEKAISLAGGFTEIASPDDISIVENDDKTGIPKLVNMKTLVSPRDIIIVKEYPKFFVNGEVNKPGAYAYEPSLTVAKAISIAGGFTEFASSWSKILIVRDGNDKAISVNLKTPIKPGDIITIQEGFF